MHCLRCFLKYSHYVHWSEFQIIGKDVIFHKDSHVHFLIKKMLEGMSFFPRQDYPDPVNTIRGVDDESDSSSDDEIRNNQTSTLEQPMVRMQLNKMDFDLGTVPGLLTNTNVQLLRFNHPQQYQSPFNKSMDFSNPVNIVNKAAGFLHAGDYGTMLKVLEILDKHLILPEDIDMAKEFEQGLAHYKNLHYRAAKPCFNALFEKSINYGSSGNQALASIYLGEIEMSWAKYKDAEKHFTLAVTYYSSDNVAGKFQETILTKSAVLVKKGQCHRSLSQIKEAISAFKMAKEIAELAQGQTRGSKLKTAKEDELSALCALGNILQSIGDYEQSFDYYEKSLKLAGELGDHISVGWAHGNLGNAMLGLDQKDKALDHLIAAFHMSARYEGNPLAVGRAVSNLGNAYQAIGDLRKAKEYYEIALGHAIYGNDLQGQGRACGNIGNVYMLLKEPVKAVHYYTETLRLSTDKNTKITGYHNRGYATYDVAECILQGKKPKELVTATTPDSAYGTLTIKLQDKVITTDPVQETKPNREPSAQSVSEQRESSMTIETLKVYKLNNDQVANVQLAEARLFLEAAKKDLLQAMESHEQSVQGSHDTLSLSLSLFESNSRSFYKMQETLVELGKLLQQLSELDMVAAEPQEFKEALVYGEQARARTLGELVLQKKKTMYSDLFSIFTPLKIQDIYKTVELQKVSVVFISYCVTKLLMWILVSVKDEVIMKCQSIDLKEEELENSSFELYIIYSLLQFLGKDEIYIFRRYAYEQESPFTVLHDVIGVKIIEGLKCAGFGEVTEFIVIPDSVTHLLPFCPLMNKDNWQFFGDKYRIRIVPSFLSLLVMSLTSNPVVEAPGDKSDFLIVGNPTIPAALVVLSSCDSARGQVKAEGFIGMARALLSAGAHSVLVSLWRVPDESANIFMQFFYQFLVNGLPSLEALQRSMQCLRCFLEYSHYVHWSGFQIIGKEVTFHKVSHAHFPIQKMLGEVSIFPRQQHVKSIEESLLGVKNAVVLVCFLLLFLIYASAVNTSLTPQTSAGTSHVGLEHEGKIREAAAKPNSTVMSNSLYTCSSSNTLVFSSNYDSVMEPMTSTAQELLLMDNSESLSLNVIGHSRYSPSHTIPTISCSDISVDETIFQENVLCKRSENTARGYGDGSSSSSDDDKSAEDKQGTYTSFASHHHSSDPQHSSANSPRYESLSVAVNTSLTPQTSAGTSHIGLKHEGKMREVAAKPNSTVMSNSLYTCYSSNTLVFSSNYGSVTETMISTAQELLLMDNSESLSLNIVGHSRYSPSHTIPTISCSGISVHKTMFQESVFCQRSENTARGYGDGSSSSSDDDNSAEDKQGTYMSFASHYHSSDPQHSSANSPRYKSLSAAVNTSLTPQTSAGTSHVGLKHEGKIREAAAKPNLMVMGFMLPKSPAVYTSKGDCLIGDSYSLAERRPILLDAPNGRNELVMAAYSTQSIPKLYPIVGLRKELPGIALPPPIPLDLPKINFSGKVTSIISHQQVVSEQLIKADHGLGTVPRVLSSQRPQSMVSGCQLQQQAPSSQSMAFSDPVGIISRAAKFLHSGDYNRTIKVLEILDKHLALPQDIDMAKAFGQGLAYYKNLDKIAAKPYFNTLLEQSVYFRSPGNQALASVYLGEIEMLQAKYKDAEKHFTLAVTYYSSDNVAEKFQETIFTKSAVLVKKGQCHRSLSQIREAISAFKMSKEIAELAQEQTRGSKLKIAKEDELSALCALGNILQSIGDYELSLEYYEKSLKLAGELGDHVSVGRAHGNLGNAMLGLDQKDKALDHLIAAFHMSARYERNLLAVEKAAHQLGNAYQAIGDLPKAKALYKIALRYAIDGNDLDSQKGYICEVIAYISTLLKEPAEAVYYYTEAIRLSMDKTKRTTLYHNRGCARFDVAECILQDKKPKELVTATTPNSVYGTLTIKLTDKVVTTDPAQETEPNSQSVSKQEESNETLPEGKTCDNIEIDRLVEALPFLETAISDFHEAIESHEQSIHGSHKDMSRSSYKIQEALVELGKLRQRLSELGVIDMADAVPREFKEALVYGEQARARTLGELMLQKKRADLPITTPLKLQDIYRTVKLQKVPVVFLSYCVSKLLMWILVSVKDEVVMKCQSIDLNVAELENTSLELYLKDNLQQFLNEEEIHIFSQCSYEQESPFTVLYDLIGVKIIEGLKNIGFSEGTEFIIIPDTVTHSIPFSSLMNKHNCQCFGDKYRIRNVPSFLCLLVMSMTSNPVVEVPGDKSDFLIVGNPTIPPFMYDSTQWNLGRLPYAEKEAIDIASILGTDFVLRRQATKQSVLDQMRSFNHKVIHLATHGSPKFLPFASSFPVSKSGLAEKEHILIFPKEIETLNISPALVVLSSCDSARGQVKAEGVIGAFLLAGAHSVLAKLWRAPDESTNIFMQLFYRFLINGLPSLEALQRSMQCLRCFPKYSHYVHWSGFQIIGKEVTFRKNSHTYFPIQKMLGEVSIFPRQHVKSIEESLLGVKNKIFTDVQVCLFTMIYKLWLHIKGKILLVGVSGRLHPHLKD